MVGVFESLKFLICVPGLILVLLIAGAILVSATVSYSRAGKVMVSMALFLFVAIGNGLVAYRILERLEKQYPPIESSHQPAGPSKIVVLTSVGKMGSGQAFSSIVDSSALYRLVEAAALFNLIPESETSPETVSALRR
jgi:hypothetical protein